jgi:hypothetical protein
MTVDLAWQAALEWAGDAQARARHDGNMALLDRNGARQAAKLIVDAIAQGTMA